MKILLFGCGGQVGWELQRSLGPLGQVIALDNDVRANPQGLCGDFTDLDGLARTVRETRPHVIVNAAAHTAVDKAESEPQLAHMINALAPGVLAVEAQKLGAWLVHYSTDYVFDGSGTLPWLESDQPAPLSVYGTTKWQGEQAVAGCDRYLILRTSWVYAARGANFAKTMLKLAAERDALTVIDDQIGAPTSAELLADATAHMLRSAVANPTLAGLYHCTAAGETSWFDYARLVLELAHGAGHPLQCTAQQVGPISTAAYPTTARRPLNSRLNTQKLQSQFKLCLPVWQTGVIRMVREVLGN